MFTLLAVSVGSMGGTYGGNSVCCSAALAVLGVFEEEDILSNVMASEKIVRSALEKLDEATDKSVIREVRGRGLMIGEQLSETATTTFLC